MFSGGCFFFEHASSFMKVKHKVAISSTKNVKAEITFEREAKIHVVVIKGYHTEMGSLIPKTLWGIC